MPDCPTYIVRNEFQAVLYGTRCPDGCRFPAVNSGRAWLRGQDGQPRDGHCGIDAASGSSGRNRRSLEAMLNYGIELHFVAAQVLVVQALEPTAQLLSRGAVGRAGGVE